MTSGRGMSGAADSTREPPAPLVSVIMIFLDAERFIEEAIESVIAQTWPHWELLLVDDGSTDQSSEIALGFASSDPQRIRYLQHPEGVNRGMSASRNLGLERANGHYVGFLDADDVWLPTRLERHVAVLQSNPHVGMVYGPTLYWHSWTGNHEDFDLDQIGDIGVVPNMVHEPPRLLAFHLTNRSRFLPGICSILVKREVLKSVGASEERFRSFFEDQALLSKLFFETPVYVLDECLDRYRQHPDSAVQKAIANGTYSYFDLNKPEHEFLRWLESYLDQRGIAGRELQQVVAGLLWPYRHPVAASFDRLRAAPATELRRLGKRLLFRSLPAPAYRALRQRFGTQPQVPRSLPAQCREHFFSHVPCGQTPEGRKRN